MTNIISIIIAKIQAKQKRIILTMNNDYKD